MNSWEFVSTWGSVEPDTQAYAALAIVGLLFFGLAVYRFAAKREQARTAAHRCPPPTIEIVERPHDPWMPTPWVRVDLLEDFEGTP